MITFCASPEYILDTFNKFNLDKLKIVVGDKSDYRRDLSNKPELANKLEKLKREGKLIIYTRSSDSKPYIHTKLYILEKENDEILILHGSPNFSKNAWGSQHESVTEFHTNKNSKEYNEFIEKIWEVEKNYCEIFLEDLSKQIDNSDQSRKEVINLYIKGNVSENRNEIKEINKKMIEETKKIVNKTSNKEIENKISLSLVNFDKKTKEHLKNRHKSFNDISINDKYFNGSLTSVAKGFNRVYGIPNLIPTKDKLIFNHPNEKILMNKKLKNASSKINKNLSHIEEYLNSVDKYSSFDNSKLIKMYMYEVLLYFFWAPFNYFYAKEYKRNGMLSTKNLPYLYIYGESDSGKSSYLKFLIQLISLDKVIEPIQADDIGKKKMRNLRNSMTTFPFVIDDIEKKKIHRYKSIFNNYWSNWSEDQYIPSLIMSSNDNRPKSWFRNRAKMIAFDMQFIDTNESQYESVKLMKKNNDIFRYYSQLHLKKLEENRIEVKNDDFLYLVRETFIDLYEYANKEIPEYFPESPAETIYNPEIDKWKKAFEEDQISFNQKEDTIVVEFNDSFPSYKIREFGRDLTGNIRYEIMGSKLVIKDPDNFKEWYGEEIKKDKNIIKSLKNIFINN